MFFFSQFSLSFVPTNLTFRTCLFSSPGPVSTREIFHHSSCSLSRAGSVWSPPLCWTETFILHVSPPCHSSFVSFLGRAVAPVYCTDSHAEVRAAPVSVVLSVQTAGGSEILHCSSFTYPV